MRHSEAVEPSFPLTLTLYLGERGQLREARVLRTLPSQTPSRISLRDGGRFSLSPGRGPG